MRNSSAGLACLLAAILLLTAPARAQPANFEADRIAILAMAGNFRVTFDMRETTSWRSDYKPIAPAMSGGHEVVRVIEDAGRRIVLQHLLVVEAGSQTVVVKHWRQDWTYEPQSVLTYAGKGRWTMEAVPEAQRAGAWSQTVWQTDDSPRYGGIGRWRDSGGVRRWQSEESWRPLARRDAIRNPPYDRYLAVNRHAPSPLGWIHWQDNIKMGPEPGLANGRLVPFVQESLLNSYVRDESFKIAAADSYWNATRAYWAAIRAAWDEAITRGGGVSVAEVAETGSASAERLMTYADEIAAKKLDTAEAVKRGRAVVAEVTAPQRQP